MRICFAGSDATPRYNKILHEIGAKNRLESCYSLDYKKMPSTGFEMLLLDSGGFVARTKGINISVEQYAKFLNEAQGKYAFNLDTMSVEQTLQNQAYLEEHCPNTYIIPVYHMSDWLKGDKELLEHYINLGYKYIGIGGTAGVPGGLKYIDKFFNYCFKRCGKEIALHGLGMTKIDLLKNYPWFSVDSTSWLAAARYGSVRGVSEKMAQVKRKQHYLETTKHEAKRWVETEKDINRLWKTRGVDWDTLDIKKIPAYNVKYITTYKRGIPYCEKQR